MADTTIEDKKVQLSIYVDPDKKDEIENYFFERKIRKFQDGYREIVRLGFEEFKKKGGKIE